MHIWTSINQKKLISIQPTTSAPCLIYLSVIKAKGILCVKFCLFCLMQTKDNTSFIFRICKIADHHLPQSKKKNTVATQTGSCDFLRKTRLDAHNHYFDKMHKWNLLVILLIVLGQLCESFTYVFETQIDTDLQLFW